MSELAGKGCEIIVPFEERQPLKDIERSIIKRYRKHLWSKFIKAIRDYNLVEEGDKIAVAISGGKDSLTLLYALHGLKRFYPKKFEIVAITIDLGLGIQKLNDISLLCKQLDVDYHIVETEIGNIIFNDRMENSPCSLCAKMRKGALNEKALELGCNKIAYAHHRDDIIETMLLSLIYEGRFHSFSPYTFWDRTGLTLIRPLMYVNECDVIGFANKYELPVAKNPCPVDGHTKRQYVKELLAQLNRDNPGIKDRLFRAVANGVDSYKLRSEMEEKDVSE